VLVVWCGDGGEGWGKNYHYIYNMSRQVADSDM
jgi:hypothetical protein